MFRTFFLVLNHHFFQIQLRSKLRMNSKLKTIYPLILSIAIAGGIILGFSISNRVNNNNYSGNYYQPDKVSAILNIIERNYVDTVSKKDIEETSIPIILSELDPHSTYIPAKQMKSVNEEMSGKFFGIGVQFVIQKDTVMVVEVVTGGPSHKLGILAGDRIISVNENNIAGIGIKSDSIVSLLRGKKGTIVNVGVHRNGFSEPIKFEIERGEIPLYSVDAAYMVDNKIGYIKINRFAEKTATEFTEAIQKLQAYGLQKLIVDLRGNSGGYLNVVFRMADELLPANNMIVYTEGRARAREDYLSTTSGLFKKGKVAVLIDEFSASASEIFAGAIQDNDRGFIIGRRSFGKGLVQEPVPFIDGSVVRLTVARFYTPSGRSIQKSYDDGYDEYTKDLEHRFAHNELTEKDSIHFNDSLVYKTTGGRTVYGGGGIMPDIFVPADTSGFNNLFSKILAKNLIYHFAFDYVDQNRSELLKFKQATELKQYLVQIHLFNDFLTKIKTVDKIKYTGTELKEAQQRIETQLYSYITRNTIGDSGFYEVWNENDKTVQKAIDVLTSNKGL